MGTTLIRRAEPGDYDAVAMLNRDIQQKIAATEQRRQDASEVFARQGFIDALHPEVRGFRAAGIIGSHNGKAIR